MRQGPATGRSFPDEVRDLLSGSPSVGHDERALTLLTTDRDLFPHVCLLSRAQVRCNIQALRAVVTSRFTADNLRQTGRATLVAGDERNLHYCKLACDQVDESVTGMVAFSFTLRWYKSDGDGIHFSPLSFSVEPGTPEREHWNDCEKLLNMKNAVPWESS